MQKPNSWGNGVSGTIGAAGQTVATTKYSVGSSFYNKFGDRYARVTVKCDKVYNLAVWGTSSRDSLSSGADAGANYGELLYSVDSEPATSKDGKVYYIPIAAERVILPVLYQAAGSSATVTITYRTFND